MRKIKTKGKWLIDLMLWERDSHRLHLFSLVVLRGPHYFFRTPDIRIPMPVKPIKINKL